ncbi:MAG: YqeG family HAD IIIA-type phosphatase [Candidatus Bipolaricaulota bacterium]|nr:YqeG family HAD IIIA-type phosphatase [Candidatus Bipolaricaulota bacterium]MDW8126519.1 YqeG family HAD IIIA-type phosphatase [Candidatus Bipolaricaulota bacterium]
MSTRLIRPDEEAASLRQVDWRHLWTKGVRALLFDLDNTLCLWRTGAFPRATLVLLRRLQSQGFKIAVLTNARLPRNSPVRATLAEMGVVLIEGAKKPLPFGFQQALHALGVKRSEAAVIGDQLLTDVLGGKLAGLYTVLVPPLSPQEARRTKVNRVLERLLGRRV